MIRKDIKLTESQVNGFELLPNAPDPEERYLYSRELDLVMNKKTGELMDYYWDDMPDGYEIPLDRVLVMKGANIPDDKLGISVFYHNEYRVKTPLNKILKFEGRKGYDRDEYPKLCFRLEKKGKDFISRLHVLTAMIYLPNPDNKPIVNHKGVEKDYNTQWKKEDLCWFTSSQNRSQDRKDTDSGVRYIAIDDFGNESNLLFSKDLPSFLNTESLISSIRSEISRSVRIGHKRYGYYWKVVNIKIIKYRDYLVSSGYLTLDEWEDNDEIWQAKEINGTLVEANPNGVVRYKGSRKIDYTYLAGDVNTGFCGFGRLHRIIALIFSDIYNSFEDVRGLEVDHINSDPYDNRPCNLRFVTHLENMQNPSTIEKRQKKILCYDLFGNFMSYYNSPRECAQLMGYNSISYISKVANLNSNNFQTNNCLIFYEDTVKYLSFKLQYIYYKFDKDGNCIGASSMLIGLLSTGQAHTTYSEYINTGIPAPDGYYYQQGPDFLKDENGKRGKRIKPVIRWIDRVLPDDFSEDIDFDDEP